MPCANQRAKLGFHGAWHRTREQRTDVSPCCVSNSPAFSKVLLLISISGPDPKEVQRAKDLCEDLLSNVKDQYDRFKENPPQQRGYGAGGYQQGDRQGYGVTANAFGGYGGQQSPVSATPVQAPPPGAPGAGSPTDYSSQYAQYFGGQDPYAAYGGYQAYVNWYQQYYQQAAQQQSAPGATAPGPPSDDPPPPPPPSGSPTANGGYNSVSACLSNAYGLLKHVSDVCDPGPTSSRHVMEKIA